MLIPQTRKPIQVLLHKGLALFSPSTIEDENQINLRKLQLEIKRNQWHYFQF